MRFFLPLLLLGLVTACTQTRPNPLATQEQKYQQLVAQARPGMTRQQLYALLPPLQTPTAQLPLPYSFLGTRILYRPQQEVYAVDPNFEVVAEFQIADTSGLDAHYERNAASFLSQSAATFQTVTVKSQQDPADKLARPPTLRRIGTGS